MEPLLAPVEGCGKEVLASGVYYMLFILLLPPLAAYGYAVNFAGSSVRGDGHPGLNELENIADGVLLVLVKASIYTVVLLPVAVGYSLGSEPVLLLTLLPAVYFNGALNSVYVVEKENFDVEKVFRLSMSLRHLVETFALLSFSLVGLSLLYLLLEMTTLAWLLVPFLFAYWIVASFCYRADVYRKAVEEGTIESSVSLSNAAERCPGCGEEHTREARFCSVCGVVLDESVGTGDVDRFCTGCGADLRSGASYCHVCGVSAK